MDKDSDENPRKRVETTRECGIVCMSVTASDFDNRLLDVVIREFGKLRHAPKILSALTGASPRTAEKWLARKHAPQGAALVRLMANCEAVDAEIERMKNLIRASSS